MNRCKQFFAMVLTICLTLTLLPLMGTTAYAADDFSYSGGTLTIKTNAATEGADPGAGKFVNWLRNNGNAFGEADVKNVVIGSGVTSIGNYAFEDCTNLTSVTFPATFTSIGNSAFSGCTNLTSVTIPASVTSIGEHAFFGCDDLTTLTFEAGSKLSSISFNAFTNCSSLTSVTLPASVTSIGKGAFNACTSLAEITAPSVTSIGENAFLSCPNLAEVTAPSVTSIGYSAFASCPNLAVLKLPATPPSVDIDAFSYATFKLVPVTPDGSALTGADYMAALAAYKSDPYWKGFFGSFDEFVSLAGQPIAATGAGTLASPKTDNISLEFSKNFIEIGDIEASPDAVVQIFSDSTFKNKVNFVNLAEGLNRIYIKTTDVDGLDMFYEISIIRQEPFNNVTIGNLVEAIKSSAPGARLTLDMTGETILPKRVLEALAGKDCSLVLSMGKGVSWVIRGTDLPKTGYKNLDFGVDLEAKNIPVSVINNLSGQVSVMQLALSYDGDFGFSLNLILETGKKNAGLWANLYHYNPVSKALEYRTSGLISSAGNVILPFSTASDYAVVIDKRNLGAPIFKDTKSHWAKDSIDFATSRGLMTGTSATNFSPDTEITRADFITALGKLSKIDTNKYKNTKFTDMKSTTSYAPYANWAAEKGIMTGKSFSPEKAITRQELENLMEKYAKSMGYTLPKIRTAVLNGRKLDPTGTATRAEVAATLHRFAELMVDPTTARK